MKVKTKVERKWGADLASWVIIDIFGHVILEQGFEPRRGGSQADAWRWRGVGEEGHANALRPLPGMCEVRWGGNGAGEE